MPRLGTCESDMDIACPNCAATYRVPDSLLAHDTALRCAACGHQWVPGVVAPPEPVIAAPAPELAMAESAMAELSMAEPAETAPARPAPPTSPPPLQRRNNSGIRPVAAPRAAAASPGRLLPLAWMASVTLILLAMLALVFFGEDIAAAWPPFGHVTALLNG